MSRLLRHIVHIILPLVLVFLVGTASTGYTVTVLRDTSKWQSSRNSLGTSQSVVVTLGRPHNITDIKQRPNQGIKTAKKSSLSNVSAKSIIVIDAVSGQTLFSRSPDTPRQPASTIKVLTGIIAIDSLKNKERVPVSTKAARQPRSKVYLDHRKTYLANDLINAVLLASANDASVALAEKIAGSEKSFAKMMTAQAKRLGAKNTICKTASGLTARGQKTTARDLAVIFRKAMKRKEFATRMKRSKIRTTEGKLLRNHNKALWQIDGTLGGKTGYTSAARQTYVGKFKRGNDEIVVALMGSETMWTDIKRLVNYGFSRKRQMAHATVNKSRNSTAAVEKKSVKKRS
jgi:D-alanyl-D-alanine carboxypeptidase (penicillin-binding protein 5/6)